MQTTTKGPAVRLSGIRPQTTDSMARLIPLVVCLLFGSGPLVHATSCSANTETAALNVVMSSSFLSSTTLEALTYGDGYRVTSAIQVENWTRFNLTHPVIELNHGEMVRTAPQLIGPSGRDVVVTRKHGHTATGTSGSVSWIIEGLNRRMYIMWDAPFSFTFHNNWMGVGLSVPGYTGHPGDDAVYDQMYKHGDSDVLKFERQNFNKQHTPLKFKDSDVEVIGIMTDSHEAVSKIILRPISNDDLSDEIKADLCNSGGTVG